MWWLGGSWILKVKKARWILALHLSTKSCQFNFQAENPGLMKMNRNNEYHQLQPLTKHFNKTCSYKWLRNRLKIMISLPHTPTNYEISAWSILLKFLISTHTCLFIHTASYTIIKSILPGTYMNVPPYTLVRAYTDTDFSKCATLYCYSTPHFYLELWRSVKQYVQQNVPTKLNLDAIC